MKTPEEIITDAAMDCAGFPEELLSAGRNAILDLDAAGYVIESKQQGWNAARMNAALIGIAAMRCSDDPAADAKWAAEEAAAALKWCMENPGPETQKGQPPDYG